MPWVKGHGLAPPGSSAIPEEVWRAIVSLWTWSGIALVTVSGFFVQLPLFVLTVPFDRRRRVAGRFLRLMAKSAVKLAPTWKFQVHGEIPKHGLGRVIVVGNHCSHTDVFLISHLPWEMKWLAKDALFKVPFLGWCMTLAGDVPVKRGAKDSAERAMAACRRWLDRGQAVFIFPEGTRSETGEMREFKDGAFRLALETRTPILPVAVAGTQRALRKHDWRVGDADARVAVGRPIDVSAYGPDELARLKADTRAAIEALRAVIRPLSTPDAGEPAPKTEG